MGGRFNFRLASKENRSIEPGHHIVTIQCQQRLHSLQESSANFNWSAKMEHTRSNVANAEYTLPLISCSIHYKPRYGRWKKVIFPARNLKVCWVAYCII